MFTVSISGTKEEAIRQVERQVADETSKTALRAIIQAAPGNRISLSGSMTASTDGQSGTLSLSGSFWTA